MKDLKIDTNGDFVIDNTGQFTTVSDKDAILQVIQLVLKTAPNRWKGGRKVGSYAMLNSIGTIVDDNTMKDIAAELETSLNMVPIFKGARFSVAPQYAIDDTLYFNVSFIDGSLTYAKFNITVNLYTFTPTVMDSNGTNLTILDAVKDTWYILNRNKEVK
jgi:hypothetical protein